MDPLEKLRWSFQAVELLFKWIRKFQNTLKQTLIRYYMLSMVVNYVYTIGFRENDPLVIMIVFTYLCATTQVRRDFTDLSRI